MCVGEVTGGAGLAQNLNTEGHRVMRNWLWLTTLKINNDETDEVPKFHNEKACVFFRGRASGGQTCLLVTITTTNHQHLSDVATPR